MPNLDDTVIAQRYELIDVIGRGGQGVVYRAHDRVTERAVAVKMLTDRSSRRAEYAARLAREQQALVALAGTSAVAFLDLCQAPDGSLCLVMELLDGTDLEVVLLGLEEKGRRIETKRLLEIMDPIVHTMERAHETGILHRDLKPANIFLLSEAAGGGVRLLDFGLSRTKAADPLTIMGTVVGSPSYIAPEVWRGTSGELDQRVDVYSLGVILFRAFSGQLPFGGDTLRDKLVLATSAPRPSLYALRPDLPEAIDAWVEEALAIERDERFDSVRALWNALHYALGHEPPRRSVRPVAKSLITAWKAAASAFRRFVEQGTGWIPTTKRRPQSDGEAAEANSGSSGEIPLEPQSRDEWMDVDEADMVDEERPQRGSEITGLRTPSATDHVSPGETESGVHEVDSEGWAVTTALDESERETIPVPPRREVGAEIGKDRVSAKKQRASVKPGSARQMRGTKKKARSKKAAKKATSKKATKAKKATSKKATKATGKAVKARRKNESRKKATKKRSANPSSARSNKQEKTRSSQKASRAHLSAKKKRRR